MPHAQLNISTFSEWITYIFDHPVTDPAWHWDIDADLWDEDLHWEQALEYLTLLFENSSALLQGYSDAQLNQGFWYLACNACSNYMFVLCDPDLELVKRRLCIVAMSAIFKDCFAVRCSPQCFGDGDRTSPLNSVCYMWFALLRKVASRSRKSFATPIWTPWLASLTYLTLHVKQPPYMASDTGTIMRRSRLSRSLIALSTTIKERQLS